MGKQCDALFAYVDVSAREFVCVCDFMLLIIEECKWEERKRVGKYNHIYFFVFSLSSILRPLTESPRERVAT
jgi:hypothetical protein